MSPDSESGDRSPHSKMGGWRTVSASVRGASHLRSGTPNQDAVRVEMVEGGAVLAVADGHGSAKCFRSHVGSRMAVGTAVAALREFALAACQLSAEEVQARVDQQLTRELVRRWQEAVDEHIAANPVAEHEWAGLDGETAAKVRRALDQNDPYIIYGATLVAALVSPSCLVFLQLGDGEILTVSRATKTVEQPLAADANLIANETTSLCQDDAWRNFRVRVQHVADDPPALILLATDGYPNSFATAEGFRQVASDLLAMLDEEGLEPIAAALPGWLEEASQQGSGDDVSVAILYSPPPSETQP